MKQRIATSLILTLLLVGDTPGFAKEILENDMLRVEFDEQGLTALHDKTLDKTLAFDGDYFSVIVEHNLINSKHLEAREHTRTTDSLTYIFREGAIDIQVLYQLKPSWRFITKQIRFTSKKDNIYTVGHVNVFHGRLKSPVKEVYVADYGEKAAKSKTPKFLAERDRRKNPSPLAKLYRELGIVEEHLNG